jgi:hypothetical protein
MSKVVKWLKKEFWDDEMERSALIGYGIGCPLILLLFWLILKFLS